MYPADMAPPKIERFVSISDIHFPYEDPAAMVLVEKFLDDFRPDRLVINGDAVDAPMLSKYQPRRVEVVWATNLQEHLDHANSGLDRILRLAGRTDWVDGNHEDRLEIYLGSRAPELGSLRSLSMQELLGLPARRVAYHNYGSGVYLAPDLFVYHGRYIGSQWTDKERVAAGVSTITGHQHKQRVTYHSDRQRRYKNVGQGCLCKLNPPYSPTPPDWQQGFVHGYVWGGNRFRVIETEIVRSHEGTVWMAPEGVVYEVKEGVKWI